MCWAESPHRPSHPAPSHRVGGRSLGRSLALRVENRLRVCFQPHRVVFPDALYSRKTSLKDYKNAIPKWTEYSTTPPLVAHKLRPTVTSLVTGPEAPNHPHTRARARARAHAHTHQKKNLSPELIIHKTLHRNIIVTNVLRCGGYESN